MIYHDPQKKNSTLTTQVVCAVLFCAFSFSWLFWFQADLLAVAQHVLSGGVTHYDRTVGAVLITLVLQLLQFLVKGMTRLFKRAHALTYLPSMFALAVISDISPDIDLHFSLGAWYLVVPLVLVLWAVGVWLLGASSKASPVKESTGLFSRRVWVNTLQLGAMMLAVALVGTTNAVFHYRAHAETALSEGNVDEALRVGEESLESDVHLTMLRVYALSKKGLLGDCLFHYPVVGGSKDMLPLEGSESRLMMLPKDSLWIHLGARPAATLNVHRYLRALQRDSLATPAVADYMLCGYLVDRDIDGFVSTLKQLRHVGDTIREPLPRHYREALTLYMHQRSHPVVVYRDAVMEEDWNNLQELERKYPSLTERMGAVDEHYHGSFWNYYFYKQNK